MKRLALLIILLIVMIFASCAYAELQEFKYFSLDVPEGWNVIEEGAVITVTTSDKSGSLSITTDDPQGKTIEELAQIFAYELSGTPPEKEEEGAYTFEFNNGISHAVIDGDEELYMLIIGTGIEHNGEEIEEILSSLEMK